MLFYAAFAADDVADANTFTPLMPAMIFRRFAVLPPLP